MITQTRSSATAERQRVSYARLSGLAHYITDWLNSYRHYQVQTV